MAAPREQKKMLVSYVTLPRCMQRRAALSCLRCSVWLHYLTITAAFHHQVRRVSRHCIWQCYSSQPHKCNHEKHPVACRAVHNRLPDAATAPPTHHTTIDCVPAKTSVERPSVPAAAAGLRARPDAAAATDVSRVRRVYGSRVGDLRGRAAHVADRRGFRRTAVELRVGRAGPGGHDLGQHDYFISVFVRGYYRSRS